MTDKLLVNKWTVLDRLHTMRSLAQLFADSAYDEFDRGVFATLQSQVDQKVKVLIDEIKHREGRE